MFSSRLEPVGRPYVITTPGDKISLMKTTSRHVEVSKISPIIFYSIHQLKKQIATINKY